MERVETLPGSARAEVYIQSPREIWKYIFYLENSHSLTYDLSALCTLTGVNFYMAVTTEYNSIILFAKEPLDPVLHRTIYFDTSVIFTKKFGDLTEVPESKKCKLTTSSMDITYVEPWNTETP